MLVFNVFNYWVPAGDSEEEESKCIEQNVKSKRLLQLTSLRC